MLRVYPSPSTGSHIPGVFIRRKMKAWVEAYYMLANYRLVHTNLKNKNARFWREDQPSRLDWGVFEILHA